MTLTSPPIVRFAPSLRDIAANQKASRLAWQFLVVGGLSVMFVVSMESLAAFSLNMPMLRGYLLELNIAMTLLAVFIISAFAWRSFHKALELVHDATEHANRLSRRSELILNSAAEAIWVVDQEGRTTFLNPAAEKTTGWMLQEAEGLHHHDLLKHSNSQGVPFDMLSCPVCMAIEKGVKHSAKDDFFWKKDGSSFPVEYHSTPIHEDGRVVGAVLTFENISEHQMLQSQLVQAQKLESIGQLAAGIAHEINTPIQFVGDNAHFLKDSFADLQGVMTTCQQVFAEVDLGKDPLELIARARSAAAAADIDYLSEEIPRAIEQSLDGISRVAKIVRAMKEFSHPDGDAKAPVDLNKAIESTTTVARNEWKYVADLVLDLDPSLPHVACLIGELNQVVLNLLVNASHAIGEAGQQRPGGKGTIKISTRAEDEYAVIRVSDTGGGIPPHVRGKIFDPFFTTKPVGKGTGQGLAIAYSVVVDKHAGTIGFETEMGNGTTFVIRLPIREGSNETEPAKEDIVITAAQS